MRDRARRLVLVALAGALIGSLPAWCIWEWFGEPTKTVLSVLLLPGLLVSLIISGGHIHGMSLAVSLVSNCVFYSCLVYACFWVRRRARGSKDDNI